MAFHMSHTAFGMTIRSMVTLGGVLHYNVSIPLSLNHVEYCTKSWFAVASKDHTTVTQRIKILLQIRNQYRKSTIVATFERHQ